LSCSAGVRFLPGLKAGVSSEDLDDLGNVTDAVQPHGVSAGARTRERRRVSAAQLVLRGGIDRNRRARDVAPYSPEQEAEDHGHLELGIVLLDTSGDLSLRRVDVRGRCHVAV